MAFRNRTALAAALFAFTTSSPIAAKAQSEMQPSGYSPSITSSCDADRQLYAARIGVPCSSLGDPISSLGAETPSTDQTAPRSSNYDASESNPLIQNAADAQLTLAFGGNLRATGAIFYQARSDACDNAFRVIKSSCKRLASIGYGEKRLVSIKAGERTYLFVDTLILGWQCNTIASFIPKHGGQYVVEHTLFYKMFGAKYCRIQLTDLSTGLEPDSVEYLPATNLHARGTV
jgi:hypothetical protein